MDDPRVYTVDQFLKMTMDGLKKHLGILNLFEGSALNALEFFVRLEHQTDPHEFLSLLYRRIREDQTLRDIFNAKKGTAKSRKEAEVKLKERGLLQ